MTSRDALRALVQDTPDGAVLSVPRAWLADLLETAPAPAPASPAANEPERWLAADDVAARLGASRAYVYKHVSDFPFAKRLPGGAIRFSEKGLARWMERTR
jgi:predicted DNA-binding transcriptional regulator AlpA